MILHSIELLKAQREEARERRLHVAVEQERRDFYDAVANGNLRKVRSVLEDYPGWAVHRKADDSTALHLAARYGHKEVVELLLANGARAVINVPIAGTRVRTPLYEAAMRGHGDVLELLLRHGGKGTVSLN